MFLYDNASETKPLHESHNPVFSHRLRIKLTAYSTLAQTPLYDSFATLILFSSFEGHW